jgi:2'-deoxynucleoside 5'-phosphate N-hydrolase
MKIYFAGSICGGRDDVDLYLKIIEHLRKFGTVLTEHVGSKKITSKGEQDKTKINIHDRDIKWVLDSDVIIAEVTTPSLGVGYELGRAVEHNKKILCLFRPSQGTNLSNMIVTNKHVTVKNYSDIEEAKIIINKFLTK